MDDTAVFERQHSPQAALRGVPSLVWRSGQERRLNLIRQWAALDGARALVDGCGIGMYVRSLQAQGADVAGMDVEYEHVAEAAANAPGSTLCQAVGEVLPYADNTFDLVLSHEVIEHVADDHTYATEMWRVARPGARIIVFCPNRWYPFETHGHYWQGNYHFGNTPLINWLPDALRNRLAPHVRAYSKRGLLRLFRGLSVRVLEHTAIYPGYDNIVYRRPQFGRVLRRVTYTLEQTPLRWLGLSHLLVLEKL